MTTRTHHMPFGTQVLEKDTGRGVCFRLWAPDCLQVGLCIPEGEADGAEAWRSRCWRWTRKATDGLN